MGVFVCVVFDKLQTEWQSIVAEQRRSVVSGITDVGWLNERSLNSFYLAEILSDVYVSKRKSVHLSR